jgi:hypothetical protein
MRTNAPLLTLLTIITGESLPNLRDGGRYAKLAGSVNQDRDQEQLQQKAKLRK